MKSFNTSLLFLSFCTGSYISNAQTGAFDTIPRKLFPVVRHDENSSAPDSIHIVGYLADYPVSGNCGVYCIGGTIKVKLKDPVPGYNNEFVYLVTACLGYKENLKNKINVVATKLRKNETACYYISIRNVFDSGGFPFYKLSEKETAKLEAATIGSAH